MILKKWKGKSSTRRTSPTSIWPTALRRNPLDRLAPPPAVVVQQAEREGRVETTTVAAVAVDVQGPVAEDREQGTESRMNPRYCYTNREGRLRRRPFFLFEMGCYQLASVWESKWLATFSRVTLVDSR